MRVVVSVAVAALALVSTRASEASAVHTKIALMGDAAPGLAGVTFGGFDIAPVIGQGGQVAAAVALSGAGVDNTNNESIWVGTAAGLTLIAREGDAAPVAGGSFSSFLRPSIDSSGNVAFSGLVLGASPSLLGDGATFFGASGGVSLIAISGDAAPGTTGQFSALFHPLRMNESGELAFRAEIAGAGIGATSDQGIWIHSGGVLSLAAREGDAAAGIVDAVYATLDDPVMNVVGRIAFSGSVTGPGATVDNDTIIWSGPPSNLEVTAREGDIAAGTTAAYNAFLSPPAMNDSGDVAFVAHLAGPGVDATNDQGIWSGTPGSLALVARTGDAAPGAALGETYATIAASSTPFVIGADGRLAFRATLDGADVDATNNDGVWLGRPGTLTLLAREGEQAPELSAGVLFGEPFPGGAVFSDPILNGLGQVALLTSLAGVGVDSTNNAALFLGDELGNLHLVARTGDLFDVGGGDLRTLVALSMYSGSLLASSGGQDGRPSALNDQGQLAFRAVFASGESGIFLASVPEPAGAVLLAIGGVLLWVWRRLRVKPRPDSAAATR